MRIMLVITGLGMGGAERVVTSLADCFAGRGHDVWVVSLAGPGIVVPSDKRVRVVALRITKSPFSILRGLARIAVLVRSFRPDVVHSHLVHANILMRIMRLFLPIPRLISTAHNANEEGRFRMFWYRITDRLASISTNVSDEAVAAFRAMRAVPPGRMITIHNGIPIRDFEFSESGRDSVRQEFSVRTGGLMLVSIGRLDVPKDYPNLLRALSRLDPELPWMAIVAGEGPLRASLEETAEALGIAHRVRFAGIRLDVPALLSAADIFVLSSAWEGFPMVVGEAMACERVVVATDCGGVAEFIGDTGFLVPPRQPEALAGALTLALALQPGSARSLGRLARQRVRELYSLDAAVDKWLALYSGVSH